MKESKRLMDMPEAVQVAINKYCDDQGELSPEEVSIYPTPKHVFLNQYFIVPEYADDENEYHDRDIAGYVNMRVIHEVNFPSRGAKTKIFEKIDATQNAYVIITENEKILKLLTW